MINEKYSYKDFTHISFKDLSADEFNDSEIIGSCFYIEANDWVNTFPIDMQGVTFHRCNLDNCIIPDGNNISDDCCHRLVIE